MITLIFSFLIMINPLIMQINGSDNGKIKMGYLSQHWIQSEKECSGDTLVFRPEGNENIAEAPMYLLYGGWTFFPEGQVHKHRWRKCGNDGEPPFRSGMWKKKGTMLKIKVGKEQYLYELLEVNKEVMKVVDRTVKK